jgi:hypothetical protein
MAMKKKVSSILFVVALLLSEVTALSFVNLATATPTISIWSPEHKTYALFGLILDIPLTFAVNEPVSWMAYSIDNQANVTITGNTTLTGVTKGSHSLVVYVNDIAGNTYASDWVYFTVGDIPNIYVISPKNTTYETNSITILIEAGALTGPLWIAYSIDGGAPIFIANTSEPGIHGLEANTTAYLSNGSHSIVASTQAWFTPDVVNSFAVYFTIASSTSPSPSPSPSPHPSPSLSSSPQTTPFPEPQTTPNSGIYLILAVAITIIIVTIVAAVVLKKQRKG